MYVIKFNGDEVYSSFVDGDGRCYCNSSDKFNKRKPKIFKTKKGAENHMNKLKSHETRFFYNHDFKIEEWTDEDLENHLKIIGIAPFEEKRNKQISKVEKYWEKVFKPIKGEVEVTKIEIENNICTVTYLMPYSLYENEFYFQADLDKDMVINSFCDAVIENGKIMCEQIEESIYKIENLFK